MRFKILTIEIKKSKLVFGLSFIDSNSCRNLTLPLQLEHFRGALIDVVVLGDGLSNLLPVLLVLLVFLLPLQFSSLKRKFGYFYIV